MQSNLMTISPIQYDILFDIDFNLYKYKGTEQLTFIPQGSGSEISLNSYGLKIESVTSTSLKIKEFFCDESNLYVKTLDNLDQDKEYIISITFSADIVDGLNGIYKSKYLYNGEQKYIMTSQFEPADACHAFPCVDNPLYKAVFNISFIHDKELTPISNTSIKEIIELENKKIKTIFSSTPKMSTYLVYLGLGEFEYIEDNYKTIKLKGITTKQKSENMKLALDITKKVLSYFEEYFGIEYPLDKLDLIAVPDFAAGAMENWGAITFRETAVLYYEEKSSIQRSLIIAEVVAHELAHQWFGNLVTMKWWNDLWLNESFATFMAYKALNNIYPQFDIWTQYLTDITFEGMNLDRMMSSHPIDANVKDINEIQELFDNISYDKGGSILKMLENFIGEDSFREGLKKYIQKYKYSNAKGNDLWAALSEVSNQEITQFMESFIYQKGFPNIFIQSNENQLKITQSKFSLSGPDTNRDLWFVPLFISFGNKEQRILLDKKTTDQLINNSFPYVYLNKNYSGFFITQYSNDLNEKIGENFNALNNKERIGFIHDLYNLTIKTSFDLNYLINFINKYCLEENDPYVLVYIMKVLLEISDLLNNSEIDNLLNIFSKKSISIVTLDALDNELPYINNLRNIAIRHLGKTDPEIREFVKKKFTDYINNPKSLNGNLTVAIIKTIPYVDSNSYSILKKLFLESNVQEEQNNFLMGMGLTQEHENILDLLEFINSPAVRFSVTPYVTASMSTNHAAKQILINWLIENWDNLYKTHMGMNMIILQDYLQSIIPICGIIEFQKTFDFIEKNKEFNMTQTFKQVQEKLEINLNFIKNNK